MTYRIYSGPRGSMQLPPLERDRALYKEFSQLQDALSWAGHLKASGRVALLIEGDDGTHMTKREIAAALSHADSNTASWPAR